MPSQLAHDVVGFALDYTGKTVDSIKSKPGLLNNIVTKVEGPVAKTPSTARSRRSSRSATRFLPPSTAPLTRR